MIHPPCRQTVGSHQKVLMRNAFESALTALAIVATAFLLFTGSFQVNQWLDGLMLYAPGVSLIFLPAGVKLLCILVGGVPAAVGIGLASVYLSLALWTDLPTISVVYFAVLSVGSPSVAIYVINRYGGIGQELRHLKYWHVIALSALAALLNGFGHNLVYLWQGVTAPADFLAKSMAMVFGDFLGCFVVVESVNAGTRLVRMIRA
jgi:hypothetical protein